MSENATFLAAQNQAVDNLTSSNINEIENVNKSSKSLTTSSDDDVIEEFNFSDTDLNGLSDDDDDDEFKDAIAGLDEESIIGDNNNNKSVNNIDGNIKENENDFTNETAILQLSASATENEANIDVRTIAPNEQAHKVDKDSLPFTDGEKNQVVENVSKKQLAANLELSLNSETLSEEPQAEVQSNCPTTSRKIIDVEEVQDGVHHAAKEQQVDKQMNSDYDSALKRQENDANSDSEPDDELLVPFLKESNRIAEARLAAKRQARAEAREIRMRELERQQKEQEHNADRVFDMQTLSGIDPLARSRLTAGLGLGSPISGALTSARVGNSMSSRRSSEDSLEDEGRSLRDFRHELKDVEDRFRKAMIANAQLDNERASQTYQIQLLKDKLEEMEESYAQLQREFKEKSRDYNALKRNVDKLEEELKLAQGQLTERDNLIAEQGLVIVTVENEEGTDAKRALVTVENAQMLGSVQGSLDVRLKKFSEEKQSLLAEIQQLQEQIETYKNQGKRRGNSIHDALGSDEDYEAQREANKAISDYKYKLQKAEQEIASLQANLTRCETLIIRYKCEADAAETAGAELRCERRKLQRENREAMERLEELETSNNHLLKRLDKLKNAKSALLKDL